MTNIKKLNFGCGVDVKHGWDNVDIQKGKGIKSFDFNKFPYPLKTNNYDYIFLDNVLEHLQEPGEVIDELWRITKNKGVIEIIVPHYTNKGAYSDMQHKHFFNEIAFKELIAQVVKVNKEKKFEIIELKITPTIVGKFIPRFLREKFSLFVNGLLSQIKVKLRDLK